MPGLANKDHCEVLGTLAKVSQPLGSLHSAQSGSQAFARIRLLQIRHLHSHDSRRIHGCLSRRLQTAAAERELRSDITHRCPAGALAEGLFREIGRRPSRVVGLAAAIHRKRSSKSSIRIPHKAFRFSGNSEDVPENQKRCATHITDFNLQLARIRR